MYFVYNIKIKLVDVFNVNPVLFRILSSLTPLHTTPAASTSLLTSSSHSLLIQAKTSSARSLWRRMANGA